MEKKTKKRNFDKEMMKENLEMMSRLSCGSYLVISLGKQWVFVGLWGGAGGGRT